MRAGLIGLGVAALLLLAGFVRNSLSPPLLTEARVIEQLDNTTSLVFIFETGPETSQVSSTTASTSTSCTRMPPLDDKPRAAIAAAQT